MFVVRILFGLASVVVLTSSCTQEGSNQTRVVSQEQLAWSKMTLDGDAAVRKGDLQKAEANYRNAIAEAEKLGKQNPAVAETMANLANFYYVQGEGDKADQLYTRSIALREKIVGYEHMDVAKDLIGLARVRVKQDRFDEATALFERAIAIFNKSKTGVPEDVQKDFEHARAKASKTTGK
jgi:tetratricopeptide (TPR) repeat protein